jgi:acetate---CoA ligase (ADP-forming)
MGAPASSLDALLAPRGVAVIGASRDPTKRGHQAVRALQASGYAGGIYPVNPAGGELCGLRVWETVEAIEGEPDLAVICTPAVAVPALVEACGRRGIRGAIVLAVGFGEAAAAVGAQLERDLAEAARRSGVRVAGPNTSGIMNLALGLNVIGASGIRAGRLALLVQSGNTALAAMTEAMSTSAAGFSVVAGVGNETDVRYHEYLEWLGRDALTAAILVYAEGFRDLPAFLGAARRVVADKPVVLLKGGRSEAGRVAARSHTGAVAGEYTLLRDVLRQIGVVEVRRSDELFPVGLTLAAQPPLPAGTGIAVLSDGGGHGTLAADALSELRAPLAELAPATRARLRTLLGNAANVANPVDLAGAADRAPGVFADALEALLADEGVGGVLVVGLFGGYGIRFAAELTAPEAAAADRMAGAANAARKTLVLHTLYAAHHSEPLQRLRTAGVPVLGSLETACRCIVAAHERGVFLAAHATRPAAAATGTATGEVPGISAAAHGAALREGRETLLETEVRALVAAYGVPVVDAVFCADEAAVELHASGTSKAAAMKLVSATITHKARAGGVVLNVTGRRAARTAYHGILRAASRYAAAHRMDADVRGVLLAPMLEPPLCELIVGARRDAEYGALLTAGAGGTAVEVLRDVAVRMLPVDERDVRELLRQTRAGRALLAHEVAGGADLAPLARLILDFASCFLAHELLGELELNPVFVYADRALAVDARAFLRPHSTTRAGSSSACDVSA